MKPKPLEIEITLSVSDETAASCAVVLNQYLRRNPGTEVDIETLKEVDGTLYRKICLRITEVHHDRARPRADR